MVVIAGQVPSPLLGTDAFQEVDVIGITQPITKWAYQIRKPEEIAWAVSRAFISLLPDGRGLLYSIWQRMLRLDLWIMNIRSRLYPQLSAGTGYQPGSD